MKTKQLLFGLSALVLAGSLALTSCKKKKTEDTTPPDSEQGTITDNNLAESFMNDIVAIGSQGSENGVLTTYKMGLPSNSNGVVSMPMGEDYLMSASCATLSFNVGAKTFTVDFGTSPCLCNDGRQRSGKLFFDYSVSTNTITPIYYRTPGFKMNITSSNYVVDSYSINITNKTITNTTPMSIPTGTNPGTNLTWNISANVTINKPSNGGTITWSCNRTKELINTNDPTCYGGQAVPIDWTKAKIRLNGTASGVNASSENYTATMVNLERYFTCKVINMYPFVKGQLNFTPGTRPTRYVDFGPGTCDRAATVTISGVTYAFNF